MFFVHLILQLNSHKEVPSPRPLCPRKEPRLSPNAMQRTPRWPFHPFPPFCLRTWGLTSPGATSCPRLPHPHLSPHTSPHPHHGPTPIISSTNTPTPTRCPSHFLSTLTLPALRRNGQPVKPLFLYTSWSRGRSVAQDPLFHTQMAPSGPTHFCLRRHQSTRAAAHCQSASSLSNCE